MLAFQLGAGARGENAQDRNVALHVADRLIVHHHQVAENPSGGIVERHAEIAFRAKLGQAFVVREKRPQPFGVTANVALDHPLARRTAKWKRQIFGEVLPRPVGERADLSLVRIGALGDEGVSHRQRLGQMARQ